VTNGCLTEMALKSVIGILASSVSRMAWRVEGREEEVMQSSSPTDSPWPYSFWIWTPPPAFSLIDRSRPLMTCKHHRQSWIEGERGRTDDVE
jgi:hypothetical protein